jgi:hypothetical protein
LVDGVIAMLKGCLMTTDEAGTTTMQEDWIASGHEMWKFQTSDGYLGSAYWRVAGAAIAVTRPDGSDLYKRVWGAREIFPAAWPGMFGWLKDHVRDQITADRAKRDQS